MKLDYREFCADDGAKISYVDVGSGPTLVYVVGFGESVATSNAWIERASRRFRCVMFDRRGSGNSASTADVGVERTALDLRNLLEKLDLHDVFLVGFSMGTTVVLSYWNRFGGDRVGRLAAIDAAPKLLNDDDWNLGLWQGRYRRADLERDLTALTDDSSLFSTSFFVRAATKSRPCETLDFPNDRDAWLERVVELTGLRATLAKRVFCVEKTEEQRRVERRYWETMCVADYRETLRQIDVPTLLIFANPGSFYSPKTGEQMAREIPNATLKMIDDAAHSSMSKDKSAEIIQILEDFCFNDDDLT